MSRILLLSAVMFAGIPGAQASRLVLTMNNPVQTGSPGDFLNYDGYFTYEQTDPGDLPLSLNADSVQSPSENLWFTSLGLPPGFLNPGDTSQPFSLFLAIDPAYGTNGADIFGLIPFDYTLYGGTTEFSLDLLINGATTGAQAFWVNIVDPNAQPGDPPSDPPPADPPLTDPNPPPAVPEPSTWILTLSGLALLGWKGSARRRQLTKAL